MFEFLSAVPTERLLTGIHDSIRFLRHQPPVQEGNLNTLDWHSDHSGIIAKILSAIYAHEQVQIGHHLPESITDVYIAELADIGLAAVSRDLNCDLARGRDLLGELRQSPVINLSSFNEAAASLEVELQELVANIWREVLKIEEIGLQTSFFELGGNSLLLLQVGSELRRATNIDISVLELFQHPTVWSLARHLTEQSMQATESNAEQLMGWTPETSIQRDRFAASNIADSEGSLHWYLIKTQLKQESRAESNLSAWGVEVFYPKIKEQRRNQFSGVLTSRTKPFFSRYLFARFNADKALHKIWFTRGVHSVVSFNGKPIRVAESVIALIRSRTNSEGFVMLEDNFEMPPEFALLESLSALKPIFDKGSENKDRVTILVKTLTEQLQQPLSDSTTRTNILTRN